MVSTSKDNITMLSKLLDSVSRLSNFLKSKTTALDTLQPDDSRPASSFMVEANLPESVHPSSETTEPDTSVNNFNSSPPAVGPKWSHKPQFTSYVPAFDSAVGLYNIDDVGEGVAILTPPALAPTIYERLHRNPNAPPDLSGLKFVKSSGSKGNLVVASRRFTCGEVVITEPPILIGAAEQEICFAEKEKYLKVVVDRLPEQSQKRVTSLRSDKFQDDGHFLLGVLATNAGSFVLIEGIPHFALYPTTALVNHDCGPNLQFRIDPDTLAVTFRASRDIGEDEELCMSYWNVDTSLRSMHFQPVAARQAATKEGWGYKCECARCGRSEASEAILGKILAIESELGQPDTAAPEGKPGQIKELVELYRKDGLDAFLDGPYGRLALAHSAAGNADEARKYARRAADVLGSQTGVDEENSALGTWRAIAQDPLAHMSFRSVEPAA